MDRVEAYAITKQATLDLATLLEAKGLDAAECRAIVVVEAGSGGSQRVSGGNHAWIVMARILTYSSKGDEELWELHRLIGAGGTGVAPGERESEERWNIWKSWADAIHARI